MIKVRKATALDAEYIALNMRQADRDEFYKSTGDHDCLKSIMFGLSADDSVTYCIVADQKPMALVGCIEKQDYQVVWACGTDQVKKYGKSFVAETRRLLEKHRHKYKPYVNYVDCENLNAVRYLKHVGFQLLDPIPYGKLNAEFYPFIMG